MLGFGGVWLIWEPFSLPATCELLHHQSISESEAPAGRSLECSCTVLGGVWGRIADMMLQAAAHVNCEERKLRHFVMEGIQWTAAMTRRMCTMRAFFQMVVPKLGRQSTMESLLCKDEPCLWSAVAILLNNMEAPAFQANAVVHPSYSIVG